jgi:hypothetical protein
MTDVMEGQRSIEEAVAELGQVPPPDVEPLRARLRIMPEAARDEVLATWARAGLPNLVNPDGAPAVISPEAHRAIADIISGHEPWADTDTLNTFRLRLEACPMGTQVAWLRRAEAQHLDISSPGITEGQLSVAIGILRQVEAEADALVATLLPPVAQGDIITQPVADPEALAQVVDWSQLKASEIVAHVGHDPAKAAEALAAERARPRPRKTVLDKLEPLVPTPSRGQEAPAADAGGSDPDPTTASTTSGNNPPPSALEGPPALSPTTEGGSDAPLTPTDEAAAGEGQTGAHLNETTAPADPSPVVGGDLGKYAQMLMRLGSEMLALGRLIDHDLKRVGL